MKKYIFLFEIIIWCLLISTVIWLGNSYYNSRIENKITVAFNDIDGLDIGAPVNMMGVNVGYIDSFYVEGYDVFVTFILNDSRIKIPKGSTLTVQFTGLVGSKTLEIEPPSEIYKGKQDLITVNPIRINSFIKIMAQSLDSVAKGSKNFLKMFGDGKIITAKQNISQVSVVTHNAAMIALDVKDTIKNAGILITTNINDINLTINNSLNTTDKIIKSMHKRDYDEETLAVLRAINNTLIYFYKNLEKSNYHRYIKDVIVVGEALNRRMNKKSIEYFVSLNIDKFIQQLDNANEKFKKANIFLSNVYEHLECVDAEKFFNKLLRKTNTLKNASEKLEKAI